MHLYIKFSSADYAKKFNGMALLAALDLSEPILLNGEIEFEAEDNYDECGPGYEDEEYMISDFNKIKNTDQNSVIACVTNADEESGLYKIVYSKADSKEVFFITSAHSDVYRKFGCQEWFDLCDSLKAKFEDSYRKYADMDLEDIEELEDFANFDV